LNELTHQLIYHSKVCPEAAFCVFLLKQNHIYLNTTVHQYDFKLLWQMLLPKYHTSFIPRQILFLRFT